MGEDKTDKRLKTKNALSEVGYNTIVNMNSDNKEMVENEDKSEGNLDAAINRVNLLLKGKFEER